MIYVIKIIEAPKTPSVKMSALQNVWSCCSSDGFVRFFYSFVGDKDTVIYVVASMSRKLYCHILVFYADGMQYYVKKINFI